jgi:hypothetical protein
VALFKSLSRFLSPAARPAPAVYLAAFGKHPGWNDHLDDLGLDTQPLINAKRLLYLQGISQNIDSGAWDKLADASDAAAPSDAGVLTSASGSNAAGVPADNAAAPAVALSAIPRLEHFRHDFLWYMPDEDLPDYLAGRLWSSSDGKGRDKYPMVVCSHVVNLPDCFCTHVVMPLLAQIHEKCLATTSSQAVRDLISSECDNLRSHIKDSLPPAPFTPHQLAAVANHPDMQGGGGTGGLQEGFHRVVYSFARGMSAFRIPAAKAATPRRPEHVRLPSCGMTSHDALLFYLRFALTFVDPSTPLFLIAPDQSLGNTPAGAAPWVDLIAGEPAPSNLFCIKAGTKSLPFTSDIPYTLDPSLIRAIDAHLAACAAAPDSAPLPPWPMFQ